MTRVVAIRIGGIFGLVAVALGAFGAHGLKAVLEENGTVKIWETAAHYHLIHSVAMLLLWSVNAAKWKPVLWFGAGIFLFSGSLYVMALTQITRLGMVTPLGGICFMIGWLAIVINGGNTKNP